MARETELLAAFTEDIMEKVHWKHKKHANNTT